VAKVKPQGFVGGERRDARSSDLWRTPEAERRAWCGWTAQRGLVSIDPFAGESSLDWWQDWNRTQTGRRSPRTCWTPPTPTAAWCNPPYGRALRDHAREIDVMYTELALVVACVAARPGSAWWSTLARPGRVVIVPRARWHFDDAHDPAMFPTALIIGGTDPAECDAYAAAYLARVPSWACTPLPASVEPQA
jgi:hypothetical protein